jgi:circadian clock protein KaiC
MNDRLMTGIAELDEMTNGGLIKNSITLITGTPGSGKSTLATQFLLGGISRGEGGVYISFEEDKDSFFRNMRGYGWDLTQLERERRFHFEYLKTEQLQQQIHDGYKVIEKELEKVNGRRVVVDSVTAYLLSLPNEAERREELKKLFMRLKQWGVTAVLTCEAANPLSASVESNTGVEYLVDTTIRMYHIQGELINSPRKRFIGVMKMRGSNHSKVNKEIDITEKGIVVLPTEGYVTIPMSV